MGEGRGSHNSRAFCANDERVKKTGGTGATRKNGFKNLKILVGHMSQAGSDFIPAVQNSDSLH